MGSMRLKKVIIDCDAGVDDALALILAFHSPELEVKAITAVSGNVPVDLAFENIQKVLSLIEPEQRPWIAKGADRPLKGPPVYAYSFHGRDGLGEAIVDRREDQVGWESFPRPAHDLILQLARQFPRELSLVALGPLTNIARGLEKDPEGMRHLKELVIMGGAVRVPGNITPHAEFNVYVDPLAARRVLGSGLPITLVPLDVTHQVFLTPFFMEERVNPIGSRCSRFAVQATGYGEKAGRFRNGAEVFHLHDPLAVAVTFAPGMVETEGLALTVETQAGAFLGKIIETPGAALGEKTVHACLRVDAEGFMSLFLKRLSEGLGGQAEGASRRDAPQGRQVDP